MGTRADFYVGKTRKESEWIGSIAYDGYKFEENKKQSKSWKNSVQALRKKYDVETGKLTLILIGKDGGEKMRQVGSIDLQSIFKRIDSMPMRQSEMRRQKKQ